MSRHMLSLAPDQRTACDLDAFVAHAEALNQHNRHPCTTPFPKDPSRWRSHDAFTPHPMAFTSPGDVDGGLRWLVGSTLDFSFTRALCAPRYGTRGGRCFAPASLSILAVAITVDQYGDDAQCCRDLHDSGKGQRDRPRAGLHDAMVGEDALAHFRSRSGDAVIDQIMAVAVDFLSHCGLLTGEIVRPDGQREPSYARDKGCTSAWKDGQACTLRPADRQALGAQ